MIASHGDISVQGSLTAQKEHGRFLLIHYLKLISCIFISLSDKLTKEDPRTLLKMSKYNLEVGFSEC